MSAAADEIGQVRNDLLARDGETIAKIVAASDAEFGASMHQTKEGITAIMSNFAAGSTTDLALDEVTANVAF